MENYEILTLNLIGEGMTPKARYERMQFLLNVYENFMRAAETLCVFLDYRNQAFQDQTQCMLKRFTIF